MIVQDMLESSAFGFQCVIDSDGLYDIVPSVPTPVKASSVGKGYFSLFGKLKKEYNTFQPIIIRYIGWYCL